MEERAQSEGPVTLSVDDVIITDELPRRPARPPDYAAENQALTLLANGLPADPNWVMQKLPELVLQLCHADSAGISVLECEGGEEVFRWHAAAGALAHNLHGTIPRSASPCGTVVTRNRAILFNEAGRFFPALRRIEPRSYESLLVPWEVNGRVTGTVWAIKHTAEGCFDAEDARLLTSLARFAGAAYSLIERARHATAERVAALNLTEDAIAARREAEQASAALRESEAALRQSEARLVADLAGMRRLYDLHARLVTETDLKAALDAILAAACEFTHTDRGCVQLISEEGERLEMFACRGYADDSPFIERFRYGGFEQGCDAARVERQRLIIPDTVGFPGLEGTEAGAAAAASGIRAAQFTPMVGTGGEATGVLSTQFTRPHVPSDTELRLVDLLAWTAANFVERYRATAALRESEARFHSLANLVPDLLWESARDGSTGWYNHRWTEYTGQTFEEAAGWGWADAIHPDDREASVRRYGEAVERGEPLRLEQRIRRHDGAYRWFIVNSFPLKDEGGRVVSVYGAATDIHDQRTALDSVRESEERLRKAVSIETVGVIFFDLEGVIRGANEAFAQMSGYTPEQFAGGGVRSDELTPPEFMEATLRSRDELLSRGESTPYEKQYVRPDGSRWWGLFSGRRLSENECVEFVLDITERKRAEEALSESEERSRLVVESALDYAIFTTDPEGLITSWSPGAEAVLGWAPNEAIGRPVEITFTPEDIAAGMPEWERATAREQGVAPDVRWHLRRDTWRVFIEGVTRPLRDSSGAVRGFLKIGQDVTTRRSAEDALRRTHEEMEERVRERTLELAEANVSLQQEVRERAAAEERVRQLLRQLVTVQEEERRRIARELHDTLGQQLTALHLSIDMIKTESEGRARLREHIGRAESIFDRLNADVDFLAWELRPDLLDRLGLDAAFDTFIREWSEHFHVEAHYHGLGPDAPRLPPEVETNLYRILQEALQNVHKHAGADRVSVQLQQLDGRAVLVVEDNGRGYDADAEVAAGTNKGMGVTNMRERAALVGGELEVESTTGVGTTIYVRVPASRDGGQGEGT